MSDDSKNSEISLERVLALLDKWRHLPAYQLERRVDVIFALFLPEVLEKRFGTSNLRLIPEFPIKKSLLSAYRDDKTEQSINVDYLAVSEDLTRAFLIELKTDMTSIKEEQLKDLESAKCQGMVNILCGLKSIAKSDSVTRNKIIRGKYYHLLMELKRLGLIQIPNVGDFDNLMNAKRLNHEDYKHRIGEVKIESVHETRMDIVFVTPKEDGQKVNRLLGGGEVEQLHFKCIKAHARGKGIVGSRFADSLERWEKQAGLCLPP